MRSDRDRARGAGARNRRVKALVARIVEEYLRGRPAEACMADLVRAARDGGGTDGRRK